MIQLSILIPTITERKKQLFDLCNNILKRSKFNKGTIEGAFKIENVEISIMIFGGLEIITAVDNKEMTIGQKRELLYQKAKGRYSWQIDDDDDIEDNAIESIFQSIKQEPDCITFLEHCSIDGGIFSSRHSLEYNDWEGNGDHILSDGFHYHRTPFFKSVIKTEIARSVPIPHIRFGEDHQWAQVLKPHLKNEIHIDKYLYFYQHTSTSHNERYGIVD